MFMRRDQPLSEKNQMSTQSSEEFKHQKYQRERMDSVFFPKNERIRLFVARYRPSYPGDPLFVKPKLEDIHIKNDPKG